MFVHDACTLHVASPPAHSSTSRQRPPLKEKPGKQGHEYDPSVFAHVEFPGHECVPRLHSFESSQTTPLPS